MKHFLHFNFPHMINKRQHQVMTKQEHHIVEMINNTVKEYNVDNVTRTKAYLTFYQKNPEIKWALLASMVSRNAGWNMTDLTLNTYQSLFSNEFLKLLFHSFERPNWLIFSDAFPQLLLYDASKQLGKPLFHLSTAFNVSIFMEYMWGVFWKTQDQTLLCYSQIINEQQLIQKPVLEQRFYKGHVFGSIIFHLQELLHLNAVIFPSRDGKLYGFSVYQFNHVDQRIKLGKQLFWLLFKSQVSPHIMKFAETIQPTGSRIDYEQFFSIYNKAQVSQPLQLIYQPITHHRSDYNDWFTGKIHPDWFDPPKVPYYDLTEWYTKKRNQVITFSHIYEKLKNSLSFN